MKNDKVLSIHFSKMSDFPVVGTIWRSIRPTLRAMRQIIVTDVCLSEHPGFEHVIFFSGEQGGSCGFFSLSRFYSDYEQVTFQDARRA